jgi:hypothetical protein
LRGKIKKIASRPGEPPTADIRQGL